MERTAPAKPQRGGCGERRGVGSVWGSGLVSHADAERICMPPHQSGVVGRERVWKQKPRGGSCVQLLQREKKKLIQSAVATLTTRLFPALRPLIIHLNRRLAMCF